MSLRRVMLVLALLMGGMLAATAYRQVTWQHALSAYREGRYREADAAWQRGACDAHRSTLLKCVRPSP